MVFQNELQARSVKAALNQFVREILLLGDVTLESSCKLPCQYMNFHVQKLHEAIYESDPVFYLSLNFVDTVDVLEEQSNYDGFDLIVETGSSLGLWLGLSLLGIFDILVGLISRLRWTRNMF